MRVPVCLFLIAMAGCTVGSRGGSSGPEDIAGDRGYSYSGPSTDLNTSPQRDFSACPDTMPTGGAVQSDHEGVGSFFCEY
jgi:hypothetical protein